MSVGGGFRKIQAHVKKAAGDPQSELGGGMPQM
jgi:hypothetical protein